MGLCNLHASEALDELTHSRPIASTSFLGRYAFIDFPLSNFSNSGIDEVGILVQNHPRSILKHLGSTNVWNTNTKLGYEAIMYNEAHAHSQSYNHDINNISANDWIFYNAKPDMFVIAPSHIIYPFDYRPVISLHEQSCADITIIYTSIGDGRHNFVGGDILSVAEDGSIKALEVNKGTEDTVNVSLETYIIDIATLQRLLATARQTSAFFSLRDIIRYAISKDWIVRGYRYQGYVRRFASLKEYRHHSLELLDYSLRRQLFQQEWPIYTVTHDTPPAKYGEHASIKNSFIANGSRIDGKVINSIISRNVVIEEGAIIKNSIVFTDTHIGRNVRISNAVIDKYAKIREIKDISGTEDDPIYVKQGDRI